MKENKIFYQYYNLLGSFKFLIICFLKIFDSILSIISLSLIYPLTLFVLENDLFYEKLISNFSFLDNYDIKTQLVFVIIALVIFVLFRYFLGHMSIKITSNYVINTRFRWVTLLINYFYSSDYLKLKKEKTGKLVSDWFNDTFNAAQFLNTLLASINNLSFLFLFIIIVFLESIIFGSFLLLFLLIFFVFYLIIKNKSQLNKSSLKLKYIRNIMTLMTDIVSFIRDIKIFSLEKNAKSSLNLKTKNLSKILIENLNSSKRPALFSELVIILVVIIFFSFFYFIDFESVKIDFSYTVLLLTLGFKSLGYISQILKSYYKAIIDFKSFNSIAIKINAINSDEQSDNFKVNKKNLYKLIIKDLNYSYGSKKVLKNLNLEIPLKNHILITGDSGSGKSTLLDILVSLISNVEGSIKFLSNNKKVIKNHSSFYSYVSQEVGLFGESINSCIIGNLKFNQKKFDRIIDICELQSVIDTQKQDFNIALLSGGQKTRIGLARALYYDRPILILDESLSSLEKELEENIIRKIRKFNSDITILQVIHERTKKTLADYRILITNGKAEISKAR